jgi:putative sigma-54 modulation protein
MRLVLTGRHVEVNPTLRRLADQKLGKLERLLNDGVVSAQVVLTLEKYRHVVDITVHARGDHMLHGVGKSNAWEASFSDAVEKIEQQVQKLKGKWQERKRRARPAKAVVPVLLEDFAVEEPVSPPPRILRASRYAVKSMTVEEAAMAVDDGKDTFLVFRNAKTDSVNVLYRRKDGQLGLIEPGA